MSGATKGKTLVCFRPLVGCWGCFAFRLQSKSDHNFLLMRSTITIHVLLLSSVGRLQFVTIFQEVGDFKMQLKNWRVSLDNQCIRQQAVNSIAEEAEKSTLKVELRVFVQRGTKRVTAVCGQSALLATDGRRSVHD